MPGGRAMRKLLLGLSLVLLLLIVPGATAAAQASTLLSDDYEGAVKWNTNSSGWAPSTTRVYGGTYSAHAPSSPNNRMIYGPFDLSLATAATLSFQLWYYAPQASFPPGTTAGAFLAGYSLDGSWYTFPYQWSGSTSGEWWPTDFDLGGSVAPRAAPGVDRARDNGLRRRPVQRGRLRRRPQPHDDHPGYDAADDDGHRRRER